MFIEYSPTKEELEMVELKAFLSRNNDEPTTQDELIAKLVHAIRHFDFYYHYSDDVNVWRSGEKEKDWIDHNLKQVEDPTIQYHLSSHFNKDKYQEVGSIFPWGKYLGKSSTYVRYCWNGKTDLEARTLVGLKEWFDRLSIMAIECHAQGRVVYSDDIHIANKLLREGITWYDDRYALSPVTVSNKFWNELCEFSKMYLNRVISFSELKECMPFSVEVILTEKAEILRLGNFYVMFTYSKLLKKKGMLK